MSCGPHQRRCLPAFSPLRGQIKIIMRGAVSLAPSQGLATGAAAVQQLLATCLAPESSPAAKHVHMEAAVFLLECVVQPLAEGPAAQQPALADGLAALLQQMLGIRIDDSVCITLVGAAAAAAPCACRGAWLWLCAGL